MIDDVTKKKMVSRLKNHRMSLDDLCDVFKKEPDEMRGMLSELSGEHHVPVDVKRGKYHVNMLPDNGNVFVISRQDSKERNMKFAVASDLHFASKFHLPRTFNEAMKRTEDAGIKRVYVAGDICDGVNIYRGHLENLVTPSLEGQTDIAAEAFSKHPNLEFWGIAGNHDYSFTKAVGAKPLSIIEAKADNFKNLGDLRADVIYHGIRLRLLHGGGGRAYATSYPAQTYLRDLFKGSERDEISKMPHVIGMGHYHTVLSMKDHGIVIVQPGSFQDGDNEFCLRRGLSGPNGCFHMDLDYKSGKIREWDNRYIQPAVARREKGKAFKKTTVNY